MWRESARSLFHETVPGHSGSRVGGCPRVDSPPARILGSSSPDKETAGEVSHKRGQTRRHRAALSLQRSPRSASCVARRSVMDSRNLNRTRHLSLPPPLPTLAILSILLWQSFLSPVHCHHYPCIPLIKRDAIPQFKINQSCAGTASPPTPYSSIARSPQPPRPHITSTTTAAAITSPPVARLKLLGQRLVEGRGALSRRLWLLRSLYYM